MTNRHLNKDGVGLGLAISANLAKALGGEIKVYSKLRTGSTFILKIPWVSPIGVRLSSGHLNRAIVKRDSGEQ